MINEEIKSLIQRRRLQLLVHSAIYYAYNESIVTDEQWKNWALELERLQADYGRPLRSPIRKRRLESDAPHRKNEFSSWISATFLALRPELLTLRLTTIFRGKRIYALGGWVAVTRHGTLCALCSMSLTELHLSHYTFKFQLKQGELYAS